MAKGKKAATAVAAETSEMIFGIEASKIDAASVAEALEKYGIVVSTKAGLPVMVDRLKKHFATLTEDELSGACDNCGQKSAEDLPACPFCGVGEEDAKREQTGTRAIVPAAKAAVAEVIPEAVAEIVTGGTVSDLDARVLKINTLARSATTVTYDLAGELVDLEKSELWKLRKAEGEKVAYTKFEEFVKAELEMTREYALALKRVFIGFTRKDFEQLGPSKLRMVLQIPKEHQEKMLERLRDGAPRREIEREKKKLKPAPKSKTKDKGTKAAPKPTSEITVAAVLGKYTLKMHARPAHRADPLKPAKSIADMPFARWDPLNDVAVFITVTKNTAGELVCKLDVKRVSPTE